jgi:glycosyltransferase involved in cell wall biosynthesis
MHLLIPVYFRAPLGGLQTHVRGHVAALLRDGHRATVMCRPGPFAQQVRELGGDVIETEFEHPTDVARDAAERGPFDLVHAHPFVSREVGQLVARRLGIPFIVTFHGTYLDSIRYWGRELDLLLGVTPMVRDFFVRKRAFTPSRIVTVQTGCDTEVFYRRSVTWREVQARLAGLDELDADTRRILLVTRLDEDKRFILDSVADAWRAMTEDGTHDVAWIVAGDGTQRDALERTANELSERAGRRLAAFAGWVDDESRALLYSACQMAVGPGGVPPEAMGCETPVLALGKQRSEGVISGERFFTAEYTNFGEYGTARPRVVPGALWDELKPIVRDDDALERTARGYREAAVAWFDQRTVVDPELLRIWRFLADAVPRNSVVRPQRWRDRLSGGWRNAP